MGIIESGELMRVTSVAQRQRVYGPSLVRTITHRPAHRQRPSSAKSEHHLRPAQSHKDFGSEPPRNALPTFDDVPAAHMARRFAPAESFDACRPATERQ